MSKYPDMAAVVARMEALDRGERPPWPEIGRLLDEVETSGAWRVGPESSFTAWVSSAASKWRISQILLWRYLGAARLIPEFNQALQDDGLAIPDAPDLPPDPETLNLLMQIRASGNAEQFKELAKRALASQVTRTEVRHVWAGIRTGLDVAKMRSDKRPDHDEFVRRLMAACRGPELDWLGAGHRCLRLFQGWQFDRWPRAAIGPDLTLVASSPGIPGARIHYLHHGEVNDAATRRRLASLVPLYDACWKVNPSGGEIEAAPKGFGQLSLEGYTLHVVATQIGRGAAARVLETARMLLAHQEPTRQL